MSLGDGPFGALPPCALDCFSTAVAKSACAASNVTCLCLDTAFSTQATGCTTQECGPKQGLTAMNLTMSTCQVPQDSQANIAPIVAGTLGMIALILGILRLIQRIVITRSFGWDDGFIVAALLSAIPFNCLMFPLQKYGLGDNMWTLPFDHITKQLHLLLIAEVFYMTTGALAQLSFLAFYLRIFPNRGINLATYILMGLSASFGISNAFVMIFQCTPVSFFWTSWTGEYEGTCVQVKAYSWYKAALQILMDIAIIALPILPLTKLSMRKKKKVQVVLMFCTGFIITVVSCLRLKSCISFANSTNVTHDNAAAVYWSLAESDIAIICACMPFIPSLLKHVFPLVFGSSADRYHSYRNDITPNEPPRPTSVPLNKIKMDTTWHVSSSETNLVDVQPPHKMFHPGAMR